MSDEEYKKGLLILIKEWSDSGYVAKGAILPLMVESAIETLKRFEREAEHQEHKAAKKKRQGIIDEMKRRGDLSDD